MSAQTHDTPKNRGRFVIQRGWMGVWIAGWYVSLRGPEHQPLFSERNRIKCLVLPLLGGWRIVARKG